MPQLAGPIATLAPEPRGGIIGLVPGDLVGGVGGLAFVASVVAQNVLRSVHLPANNASAATVSAYYASHHSTSLALAALYPVGAIGLAAFLGALLSRLWSPTVRAAALAGAFGGTGIIAMFTMTLATDTALAEYVHRGQHAAGVVSAMWITHNAIFGLLLVSIGVALAGLSAATATAGLVPAAWKKVGLIAAAALVVTGACNPALVGGSKLLYLGLAGFIAWVLFVTSAAVALLRQRESAASDN